MDAGTQPASCSQPETVRVILEIILLMTKSAFLSLEAQFISSVAATAGVGSENVVVLDIVELSTRSLRIMTRRALLATSVKVQTAVQVPYGHQAYLQDQSLLNSNLNKNGLPSGTLVMNSTIPGLTTPAPFSSPAAGSDAVPISAIIGGVVGLCAFVILLTAVFRRASLADVCRRVKVRN